MAHFLPPAIMAFFRPPPPLVFKKPIDHKKLPAYSGIGQFVEKFKDPIPPPEKKETPLEKRKKRKEKKAQRSEKRRKIQLAKWDPKTNEKATKDAYKTLYVGRLAYNLTEEDIKSEFEYYGPIVSVRLVRDKQNKSRGYAFVEFENSRDMKEAFDDADGRKINNRRIVVDVERGRTVKNWLPRRLGGGLGGTRIGSKDMNQTGSGRFRAEDANRGDRDRADRDRDREREREREREQRERPREREREREQRERPRERSRSRERGREQRERPRDARRERSRSPHRRR